MAAPLVCRANSAITTEDVELSIFSKGENGVSLNTTAISSKTSPEVVSTLGPGMRVTGNIVCEGPLQIFGRIIGDIHASQLIIRESAQVEGNIIAHETSIQGSFKGTIHSDSVKLQGKAVVSGEIYNKSLAIEQDVQFEGVSRRPEKPIESPSRDEAKTDLSSVADEIRATGDGQLSH